MLFSLFLFLWNKYAFAEYVTGEILVKFRNNTKTSSINNIHSHIGLDRKRSLKRLKIHHLKLPDNITVEEAIDYYQRNPDVEYAEPNYIIRIDSTPDDPDFYNLWGLHNTGQMGGTDDADIDAPEAWDITTGSSNVIIAVIDTGVAYNHPDLRSNIWTNATEITANCTNGIDDNGNGIIDDCDECGDGIDNDDNGYIDDCRGWDFLNNDNDPMDYNNHGTHVAGTIAAVGNNASGITGVMWQAKIMPLRFLGIHGSGSTIDALRAILYANANGAHILNNSWGSGGYSQALKDAIDASEAVVVCSAGNDGKNNDTVPAYPANYTSSNIISVAASDSDDNLASFSNYGAVSVDIVAPGVSIFSSIPLFGYGGAQIVYSQNFDGQSGTLPDLGMNPDDQTIFGWGRGGTNSSWAITSGTGENGNGLEDSPSSPPDITNYENNTSSWASYMTEIDAQDKDHLYILSFAWKGELESNDYLDINYSTDGKDWKWVDYREGSTGGNFVADSTEE